jgi:hypothetical protein
MVMVMVKVMVMVMVLLHTWKSNIRPSVMF